MQVSGLLIPEPLTERTNGVMKRAVLVALAIVVTAVVTILGTVLAPTPRASAQTGAGTSVMTDEKNCYEIDVPRAANLANLRAAVEDPYKNRLLEIAPGVGRFFFIDYGCKQVTVDDQTPPQRMTASLVAAQLVAPYGLYILDHATNNQQLAEQYSALGLPTKYQPATTSSYKAGEPDVLVHWEIVGDGLDHTIDAKTSEPPESPVTTSTTLFRFVTDSGQQLQLTYNNSLRPNVDAVITADFTHATSVKDLFLLERLKTIPGVNFAKSFLVGRWTSTLQETSDPGAP